jgi:riboflavin kinase/FMN adenylyltransferase
MEVIRHIVHHVPFTHPVLSLGNFDGVHVGHQRILTRLVEEAQARQGTALVLTFHPHPLAVLRPDQPLSLILSLREKLEQLAAFGVQGVILQHFTLSFSRTTPEEFVERYLVQTLRVEKVIIGHNVTFGRNRAGRADLLERLGQQHKFAVEVVGPVLVDGQEVSSTAVRTFLQRGDMRVVSRLLGHPYAVSGRVEKGYQRGRGLGFPTANLRPRVDLFMPNGVYAVMVEVGHQRVPGVANDRGAPVRFLC